jgi:ribose/xylose/arabinose/galactoside ABC-type transport system permease subunit
MALPYPGWFNLLRWGPVLLLVCLLAVMLGLNPALRSPATWDRITYNWTGEALLAIALTPIIITGGIDLSVGSIVGVSAVAAGFLWRSAGFPLEAALAGGVLAGLACGSINGGLVLCGINPLVVTLATLAVFRGLAYGLSGPRLVDDFPASLIEWWEQSFLGLPRPVWLILVVFALGYVFLHHTWMGRMIFAVGDNARAARYAGVPVRSLTFSLYAASGLMAGVVGLTTILTSGSAPANQGEDLELRAIACVVLGGVRITGGAGHLAGTMLGTLTLIALLEGLVWVPGEWRPLCTGVLLIGVALLNEGLARLRVRAQYSAEKVS